MDFEILDSRPLRKNSSLGSAKVQLPSGLIVNHCTVPTGDRDGRAVLKANGKADYTALIWFADREAKRRWEDAVITEVREAYPEALDDDGGAP